MESSNSLSPLERFPSYHNDQTEKTEKCKDRFEKRNLQFNDKKHKPNNSKYKKLNFGKFEVSGLDLAIEVLSVQQLTMADLSCS